MALTLLSQVEVIPSEGALLPKATPSDMANFEHKFNIILPDSYKMFAQVHGAGELARYYRIAVPLGVDCSYNLARFNATMRGEDPVERWGSVAPPDLLSRVLFFASTIGGDLYAWDPQDVRDAARHEYAVYSFPRGWPIEEVAGAFDELIEKVFLNQTPRQRGWVPPLEFSPFTTADE